MQSNYDGQAPSQQPPNYGPQPVQPQGSMPQYPGAQGWGAGPQTVAPPQATVFFKARFRGKSRFVSNGVVTFYSNGFYIAGTEMMPSSERTLIWVLCIVFLHLLGILIAYLITRDYGRKRGAGFVCYSDIIKVELKPLVMNILARDIFGRKTWYLMHYTPQSAPLMDWVVQNCFPSDGRVIRKK